MNLPINLFIKNFNKIRPNENRYDVFSDFVHFAAIYLHNTWCRTQALEDKYSAIVNKYSSDERELFLALIILVMDTLDEKPRDFLGEIFSALELNPEKQKRLMPYKNAQNIAKTIFTGIKDSLKEPGVIMAKDPECGSGSKTIAVTEELKINGFNPLERFVVHCTESDCTFAYMCFIQLALLKIPAEIAFKSPSSRTDCLKTPWYFLCLGKKPE